MKTCSSCHGAMPASASSCPHCGASAPRGFFALLGSLLRRGAAAPEAAATEAAATEAAATGPSNSSGPFAFEVEDVFTITGRGMVATGRVTRGSIARNDEVSFRSPSGEVIRRRIIGIETLGKIVDSAREGDTVGLLFAKPVGFDVLVRGTVFERA